jgi:hypothetical protein
MGTPNRHLALLAARELFAVDGRGFTWADVVLAELARSSWPELETRARSGLAAQQRLSATGGELQAGETTEAARRFRYERDLLAAEDLEAWLERWSISLAEWSDYLRRDVLRGRSTGVSGADVPPEEVAAAIGVEAICSGSLESGARRLATEAALAGPDPAEATADVDPAAAAELLGLAVELCAERLEVVAGVAAAAEAAASEIASESAVERELAMHRLDWLLVDIEVLEVENEDAAREALLCVASDGLELADVAAQAGSQLRRRSVTLTDAPDWLAPHLLGVEEGSVLGPLRHEDGFAVVSVVSRKVPSADDPDARRRAETALLERASQNLVAAKVEWRERL